MKIIHITPHLGGGIGTVVLNWLKRECQENPDVQHTIACLEQNKNSMQEFLDIGMQIYDNMYMNQPALLGWIAESDIVLMHWWNHPTLFDIMVNLKLPPCRLILWNHVSALHPPYIHSNKLIEFSDRFIFTSPVSYEADEIKNLPEHLKEKLGVIWSSCGTEIFEGFVKKDHKGFNVGITGTVDYGKLHPDYVTMCAGVKIPDVHFIVCSGDSQERVKEDAKKQGILDRFTFNGRVPSIMPYLAIYDVFGYPLQPKHLGTCEQAIGEAMMAGVVPVVLNNSAERYIVQHNVNGIIANSQEEYCRAIEYLYHNPDVKKSLADNAIAAAREKYSLSQTMNEWIIIFEEILRRDKKTHAWPNKAKTGSEVFIESIGDFGTVFNEFITADRVGDALKLNSCEFSIRQLFRGNRQWYSENKGGVKQYLRLFPDDKFLNLWNELLDTNPYQ